MIRKKFVSEIFRPFFSDEVEVVATLYPSRAVLDTLGRFVRNIYSTIKGACQIVPVRIWYMNLSTT